MDGQTDTDKQLWLTNLERQYTRTIMPLAHGLLGTEQCITTNLDQEYPSEEYPGCHCPPL